MTSLIINRRVILSQVGTMLCCNQKTFQVIETISEMQP